jgi:mono/diheme cytochrome c family protein
MKKFLKWTGIVLLGLVLIVALPAFFFKSKFSNEFEKVYSLQPAPVSIPTDSASIARGQVLAISCAGCHGADLGGEVFFDDPKIGSVPSSNLTRAAGSETEGYTDEDFVRAIRHGLNKNGNQLMVMPCEAYTHYSDADLGSVVAYLKTLPPVDRKFKKRQFTFMAQVIAGAGLFGNLFSYKVIDHEKAKNLNSPPIGNSREYGEYLSRIGGCKTCHGANFGGGKSPDPVSPPVPDISGSGKSHAWSLAEFTTFFRNGKTPDGRLLNKKFMPWDGLSLLSDAEIEGLFKYIQSLPPASTSASDKSK